MFQSATDAATEGNFQRNMRDGNPESLPRRDVWGCVGLMCPVLLGCVPWPVPAIALQLFLHWIMFL